MPRSFDTLESFVTFHYEQQPKDQQRLGQRFVNTYIKTAWPELFYERHDGVAHSLIEQWLIDHSYHGTMPLPIHTINHGEPVNAALNGSGDGLNS